MRKWSLGRGIFAVVCVVLGLGAFYIYRHGVYSLGIEPRYHGRSLGYWADHAYGYSGGSATTNDDAVKALLSMKREAFPFLVNWISTPSNYPEKVDYQTRALHAFELLGPAAEPAIPELVRILGRYNDWPAAALACIGSNAVPALIDVLTTNQTSEKEVYHDTPRASAILTLSHIGTNAQAALPVLMQCYRDEDKRSWADMSSALARVGANQPEVVVPALIYLLTNSTPIERLDAADALRSFGSQAHSAVPALSQASQSDNAQLQVRAAFAIKTIAPQTTGALAPLLLNLTNRQNHIREEAFRALDALGTNAMEAGSVLLELARKASAPEIRAPAIRCLTSLEVDERDLLPVVKECLTNHNESVASAALNSLVAMARKSQARHLELLSIWDKSRNRQVRTTAESGVRQIMQKQPKFILECLDNSNSEVYSAAMRFLHSISEDTLVQVRYEPNPSTNYEYFDMREMSDGNKKLLQPAIPTLVKRLQDENLEVRKLATNIILELDPKAAKKAGVQVVLPYSIYAE